ncbi:MAG TPA: condensation domain-containing protein, partial [Pyrinomonadaceae bacterium]|nr:condensation domain-containing protein [Pyrinomonadaceae bacterium]
MEKATCNTIQCDELLEAKAAVAENSLETTILASGRERRVTDAETFGSSCSANPQTSARVESYGLSPIQKGMLFHHLDARDSGVDVEQVICALDEALHKEAFGSAWQGVINRHAILRTCFRWQAGEAQQDVHDSATIELEEIDWLGVRSEEQDERWSRLLVTDRRRGFDLSVMPLMRLTLIALAPNRFRVLWTFHHILLDGRSFPIILREVFDAYSAIRDGKRISLSEPKPYREYIDWLSQQDFARSEEYWREALRGFRTPVEISLPNTPEDPAEIRGAKDFRELRLSRALTDKLRAFAKKHQLTLNTLLQGAWALLLHHYSGEEDIVFGATRACRRSALEGADDRVGLFINTLPMRVCVSSDGMLADLFHALREQQTSMRDYEHTPLSQVQRWSEVPRGRQLFESIIVFENYHLDTLLRAQGGEWLNRHFDYFGQTNYPLTVIAYADPEFLLRIEYDCRHFNGAAITRMAGHLVTLLDGLCGEGMQRVYDVPLATREEQKQLLEAPMSVSIDAASDTCLHQLFEAQVEKTPEAVAVVCQGKSLTYGELNQEAEKIAYRLRRSGVGPEVLVGLCVDRSVELVIGIVGILKAGGAYLPLDPSYPKERLAFMLDDASVSVLLTQAHLTGCLPDHQAAVIHFDHDDETTCPEPLSAETELAGVNPDNLAYVIYTSGSTGKPKGVLITHRNVARLFPATAPWFGFDPSHVWTLFHSYAFDFSVWEMWGALLHGGRL